MPVNLTEVAKDLRKSMTDAERVLWQRLKAKQLDGLKFGRQEQIGRFIADFVCFERGVVIEANDGPHATERERDDERTQWLNSQGFTVKWGLTTVDCVNVLRGGAVAEGEYENAAGATWCTHRECAWL
jgi:hypothetical protein